MSQNHIDSQEKRKNLGKRLLKICQLFLGYSGKEFIKKGFFVAQSILTASTPKYVLMEFLQLTTLIQRFSS